MEVEKMKQITSESARRGSTLCTRVNEKLKNIPNSKVIGFVHGVDKQIYAFIEYDSESE